VRAPRGEKSVACIAKMEVVLLLVADDRDVAERLADTVIDGSAMSKADAGHVVLQWMRDAIAGRAPIFRRDPRWGPGESGGPHLP